MDAAFFWQTCYLPLVESDLRLVLQITLVVCTNKHLNNQLGSSVQRVNSGEL